MVGMDFQYGRTNDRDLPRMKYALVLLALLLAAPAAAQVRCAPRELLVEQLEKKYGERRLVYGITTGTLMELWVNVVTGSWTITEELPSGVLCINRVGMDFTFLNPEAKAEKL